MESFSTGRGPELALKAPMVLWHERAKLAHQMRDAHRWATEHGHGCTVKRLALSCGHAGSSSGGGGGGGGWASCSGARWRLCSASHAGSEYERSCNDTRLRRADNSLYAPPLKRVLLHLAPQIRARRRAAAGLPAAGGKAGAAETRAVARWQGDQGGGGGAGAAASKPRGGGGGGKAGVAGGGRGAGVQGGGSAGAALKPRGGKASGGGSG